MRGDVAREELSAAADDLGRVVENGERIHVVRVPADVFPAAFCADKLARPVIDPADILRHLPASEGGVERLIEVAERLRHACDAARGGFSQPGLTAVVLRRPDRRAEKAERPVRQEQEAAAGERRLIQRRRPIAVEADRGHGERARRREDQDIEEPPAPGKNAGEQRRRAVGHGIKRRIGRRGVHREPEHQPGGCAGDRTAFVSDDEHEQHGEYTPERDAPGDLRAG